MDDRRATRGVNTSGANEPHEYRPRPYEDGEVGAARGSRRVDGGRFFACRSAAGAAVRAGASADDESGLVAGSGAGAARSSNRCNSPKQVRPSPPKSRRTMVSAGARKAATGTSSKPATLRSPGTRRPASRAARITPRPRRRCRTARRSPTGSRSAPVWRGSRCAASSHACDRVETGSLPEGRSMAATTGVSAGSSRARTPGASKAMTTRVRPAVPGACATRFRPERRGGPARSRRR